MRFQSFHGEALLKSYSISEELDGRQYAAINQGVRVKSAGFIVKILCRKWPNFIVRRHFCKRCIRLLQSLTTELSLRKVTKK